MREREPDYKIYGNTFELRKFMNLKGVKTSCLVKRYFVSSEFIQSFYKLMDGEFDNDLYNQLTDNEKFILSKIIFHMKKQNREFNIAVSKFMKETFERLKYIENAIKAGNLSTQLKKEYCEIMNKLMNSGMIKKHLASYQKRAMMNTNTAETQE